jgi:hypothetical protein
MAFKLGVKGISWGVSSNMIVKLPTWYINILAVYITRKV